MRNCMRVLSFAGFGNDGNNSKPWLAAMSSTDTVVVALGSKFKRTMGTSLL